MSNLNFSLALAAAFAGLLLVWGYTEKASPPQVSFTKAVRTTVVSSLTTNGKVEPIEWAAARAERAGVVREVFVQRGQQVTKGAALVSLDTGKEAAALATANAQIVAAEARQRTVEQGGSQAERTSIESDLAAARATLQNAQREHAALERLVAKQAATRAELELARQRVEQAQLRISALEKRLAVLVAPADQRVAAANVDEAKSAASLARRNLERSVVNSPLAGMVYQFDLKPGAYLNPGDVVAYVGRLERVRVTLYVDEPDLGRVDKGMPVTITWDALPGRQWKGVVDKLPTEVVPLGSRQVGEVSCVIDNPDRDLPPGSNINAEIRSRVVPDTIAIPKETLRREGQASGVFVLDRDRLAWRPLKLGVSSYTKAEVLQGLQEGDSVALPTERTLKDGLRVAPVYP